MTRDWRIYLLPRGTVWLCLCCARVEPSPPESWTAVPRVTILSVSLLELTEQKVVVFMLGLWKSEDNFGCRRQADLVPYECSRVL